MENESFDSCGNKMKQNKIQILYEGRRAEIDTAAAEPIVSEGFRR